MTISLGPIKFAQPLWFALLAALPLLVIFWRRSLVQFSLGRRAASLVLRSLLVLLVAAGLAGPQARGPASQPLLVATRPRRGSKAVSSTRSKSCSGVMNCRLA